MDRRRSGRWTFAGPNHRLAGSADGTKSCAGEGARSWGRRYSGAGSVNLPPDPRDDVMIALLEQQKLLQEEMQEMQQQAAREVRGVEWELVGIQIGGIKFFLTILDYTPPKKKRTYPFVDRIMDVAMPKLRTPTQLKHYDGTSDPVAHVNSFKAAMLYAGAPDEVMCRAFPSTLDGDAQLWFFDLPSGSISSFRQLSKRFTSYFATSRTIKRTAHCLKNVVQGKEESLKDFLIRFTKAARQIQGLKMEVELSYLTDNLRSNRLKKEGSPGERSRSLLGAETTDTGGKTGRTIGGMIGAEESGDKSPPDRSDPEKGRQEGTGDRRDQRRDDRSHRGGDQRHREDNTDNVAGTIHVIAGGVVRGTEADPHTRKRQVRASASAGDLEGAESPSGVMNTELVDPRERE
ncbi:uncharacterized protein G2W53_002203 [Senna tora]|uniref:Retrotransposon gag domain-containing protein n=1 Tax=Senna tora TaxID=362788 RepID=A0A834XIP4_9FABA|nr:uncharacterized protein G2W53_002203 [Senna tora]